MKEWSTVHISGFVHSVGFADDNGATMAILRDDAGRTLPLRVPSGQSAMLPVEGKKVEIYQALVSSKFCNLLINDRSSIIVVADQLRQPAPSRVHAVVWPLQRG